MCQNPTMPPSDNLIRYEMSTYSDRFGLGNKLEVLGHGQEYGGKALRVVGVRGEKGTFSESKAVGTLRWPLYMERDLVTRSTTVLRDP